VCTIRNAEGLFGADDLGSRDLHELIEPKNNGAPTITHKQLVAHGDDLTERIER
jgi:hypothetical protein